MKPIREFLLDVDAMQDGERRRVDCPFCNRGNKTLSLLRRDGLLLYNCFRASCDAQGSMRIGGADFGNFVRTKPAEVFVDRDMNLRPLGERLAAQLSLETGLLWRLHQNTVMYDTVSGRIAYAIRAPNAVVRGWVLRSYDADIRPKAINVMIRPGPTLAWCRNPNGGLYMQRGVIVEDIPSAMRVEALGYTGIALLGTSLSDDGLNELLDDTSTWNFCVALDPDATDKALALKQRLGLYHPDCKVYPLQTDLKNMTDEELETCLNEMFCRRA